MQSDRFKQLAKQFLDRTREELVQLEACLPAAQAGEAEALNKLQHIAHRINGSGAMLGFKEVSAQAAQIEQILRRTDNQPAASDWPLIMKYVGKLAEALERSKADNLPDYS